MKQLEQLRLLGRALQWPRLELSPPRTTISLIPTNSCQSAVTSVTRPSNILHSKLPHVQRQARILQIHVNKENNRPLETDWFSSCCSPSANVAIQIQDSLGLSHFLTHGRPATSSPYCPSPQSRLLQVSYKRLNTLSECKIMIAAFITNDMEDTPATGPFTLLFPLYLSLIFSTCLAPNTNYCEVYFTIPDTLTRPRDHMDHSNPTSRNKYMLCGIRTLVPSLCDFILEEMSYCCMCWVGTAV